MHGHKNMNENEEINTVDEITPIPHITGTINTYSDHSYVIYGTIDYDVEQVLINMGMTYRENIT